MDKADLKQDKKVAASAIHKHERGMHPGKPLTKLKSGGGVKIRGTGAATKGTRARGPMG
jgi:hypothetical protein